MAALVIAPEVATEKSATSLKQIGVRRDYQMINPRLIDIEPNFNPRKFNNPGNLESIAPLAQSIGEGGLIEPLVVRFNKDTGRATLVDGERRLRAIWKLIEENHPVWVDADVPCFPARSACADLATRKLDAIAANTGKQLYKWEIGEACRELFDMGLSAEKIAARTGYTERFIREAIELAEAPDEVKELLSEQAISTGSALSVLRAEEPASAIQNLQAQVAERKAKGETGPVRRAKAPSAAKDKTKDVSHLALYAAEEMAKALDVWLGDATPAAEAAVVESHKAYRKLIRAPKQGEAA